MTTHREEGEISPEELLESSEADVPVPTPPQRSTSRSIRRDPLIGATLDGRYEVTKLIARGGMGRIYSGEQSALGRKVALKVMDLGYSEDLDPDFQKRFTLEASTCAQLSHPNTIRVFDYGADGDIYYIAMELIEGQTLLQAIHHDAPFAASRLLHISRQICGSLSEAHRKGIIHRDLKPSNVLLSDQGDDEDFVKVLDFGLVKLLREDAQEITRSGLFLGSPNYMSPEQIRATGVDQRSDLYSLGVILFMALTGKAPFKRNTSINVLLAQLEEAPPAIASVVPDTDASPALQWTVMTCLEKDRAARFSGVDELNRALKACQKELRGELNGPLQLSLEAGRVIIGTVAPGRDPYQAHGLRPPGAAPGSELPTVESQGPSGVGGHSLPPARGSSRQSAGSSWNADESNAARGNPSAGSQPYGPPTEGPSLAGRVSSVRRDPASVRRDPASVRRDPPSVRRDPPSVRRDPPSVGRDPSIRADTSGPPTVGYPGGPPTAGRGSGPVPSTTRGTQRRRRRKKKPRWPLFALFGLGVLLALLLVVVASQQESTEPVVDAPPVLPEAVRLFSDPPNASVYKDGTFLGTTPLDLTVPEDDAWTVTLTVPGHLEETVTVPPGVGSRRVQLRTTPPEPVATEPTPQPQPRAQPTTRTPRADPTPPPSPRAEPVEAKPADAAPVADSEPTPEATPAPAEEPATDAGPGRITDTRDPWGD